MASPMMTKHKGLENKAGENNCFLNAAIQTLWHLDSFRLLLQMSEESNFPSTSLFVQLKALFAHYEYGDASSLPPGAVREALMGAYGQERRFLPGAMEDAGETLEAILRLIHCEEVGAAAAAPGGGGPGGGGGGEDTACEPPCLAHAVFCCRTLDLHACRACGAVGDPEPSDAFVYRAYVRDLVGAAPAAVGLAEELGRQGVLPAGLGRLAHRAVRRPVDQIGVALANSVRGAPDRACPSLEEDGAPSRTGGGGGGGRRCRGAARLERWALDLPLVFGVALVWDSNQVSKSDIKAVLETITYDLDLRDFLKVSHDAAATEKPKQDEAQKARSTDWITEGPESTCYHFCGMICYSSLHYVGYFYSKRSQRWLLFDDSRVRDIGSWDTLITSCENNKHQPTTLLYERAGVTPDSLHALLARQEKARVVKLGVGGEAVVVEAPLPPPPPATIPKQDGSDPSKTTPYGSNFKPYVSSMYSSSTNPFADDAAATTAPPETSTNPFDPKPSSTQEPDKTTDGLTEDLGASWAIVDKEEACTAEGKPCTNPFGPPVASQNEKKEYRSTNPFAPEETGQISPHSNGLFVVVREGSTDSLSNYPTNGISAGEISGSSSTNLPKPEPGTLEAILEEERKLRQQPASLDRPPLPPSAYGGGAAPAPKPPVPELPPLKFSVTLASNPLMGGLGLRMEQAADGALVVTDFKRSKFGGPLPAERCGLIKLMDKILQVDEKSLKGMSFEHFLSEVRGKFNNPLVKLKVESANVKAFQWDCDICTFRNLVDDLSHEYLESIERLHKCAACLAHCRDRPFLAAAARYEEGARRPPVGAGAAGGGEGAAAGGAGLLTPAADYGRGRPAGRAAARARGSAAGRPRRPMYHHHNATNPFY